MLPAKSLTHLILMRVAAKQGPDKLPLTKDKATVFVQAAETAYCPDLLGS